MRMSEYFVANKYLLPLSLEREVWKKRCQERQQHRRSPQRMTLYLHTLPPRCHFHTRTTKHLASRRRALRCSIPSRSLLSSDPKNFVIKATTGRKFSHQLLDTFRLIHLDAPIRLSRLPDQDTVSSIEIEVFMRCQHPPVSYPTGCFMYIEWE